MASQAIFPANQITRKALSSNGFLSSTALTRFHRRHHGLRMARIWPP